ncbi:MAG: hypothetical protein IPO31_02910 [Candidatus Obscuribacter sp.]|nr:hypothetical protein [Candidatus Obscuribacter sp.]
MKTQLSLIAFSLAFALGSAMPAYSDSEASLSCSSEASLSASSEARRGGSSEAQWGTSSSEAQWGRAAPKPSGVPVAPRLASVLALNLDLPGSTVKCTATVA